MTNLLDLEAIVRSLTRCPDDRFRDHEVEPLTQVPSWTWRLLGRVWRWIRATVARDHLTIRSARLAGSRAFRVHVAVAPSRMLRRPKHLDPETGHVFATATFSQLALHLAHSDGNVLRLDGPETDGWADAIVRIESSGLVDTIIDIPARTDDAGAALDVVDILEPVCQLAAAVADGRYAAVFGLSRLRRVDWSFNLTPYVSTSSSPLYWTSLSFPGPRARRLTTQRSWSPVGGFAARRLRSLRQGTPPGTIAAAILTDVLRQNGYGEIEPAVAHSVRALTQADDPLASDRIEA